MRSRWQVLGTGLTKALTKKTLLGLPVDMKPCRGQTKRKEYQFSSGVSAVRLALYKAIVYTACGTKTRCGHLSNQLGSGVLN